MGNDPDRQAIYGTTLALFTSRMFKLINHKFKRMCGVLLDEFPTIFLKGLDNLIATARSNLVAIVLGAQDKSQLKRDYGEKESEVIFNTVGNIFSGQVNGKTAEELSKSFGKEFRKRESQTRGIEQDSVNISFQHEELLPLSTIETLSQGVVVYDAEALKEEAARLRDSLTEAERDEILETIAKDKAEKVVRGIIESNFKRIQAEVKGIIDRECRQPQDIRMVDPFV